MDESKHRKEIGVDTAGMWMVVELLGHNKVAGFVSEEKKWGQTLMRIYIPTSVDRGKLKFTTQFYGTHALYCATPVNESDAIHLAKMYRPKQFSKFDLHREENMNLEGKVVVDDDGIPF